MNNRAGVDVCISLLVEFEITYLYTTKSYLRSNR